MRFLFLGTILIFKPFLLLAADNSPKREINNGESTSMNPGTMAKESKPPSQSLQTPKKPLSGIFKYF